MVGCLTETTTCVVAKPLAVIKDSREDFSFSLHFVVKLLFFDIIDWYIKMVFAPLTFLCLHSSHTSCSHRYIVIPTNELKWLDRLKLKFSTTSKSLKGLGWYFQIFDTEMHIEYTCIIHSNAKCWPLVTLWLCYVCDAYNLPYKYCFWSHQ